MQQICAFKRMIEKHNIAPLVFCVQEIGPNTPRHSVSPLAPRSFTRAFLATVNTRACIRQAASDLQPWAVKGHDTCETACRRCERWITLQSAAQHANVVAHLAWRKQHSEPRGRALDADIPASGLKKHERLEPRTGLQDIGDEFDQLQQTAARPVRVCFWRRSVGTATRHRSPLVDTLLHTLTIDILHTWFLGIHQRFLGWVWWRMLEGSLFQLCGQR